MGACDLRSASSDRPERSALLLSQMSSGRRRLMIPLRMMAWEGALRVARTPRTDGASPDTETESSLWTNQPLRSSRHSTMSRARPQCVPDCQFCVHANWLPFSGSLLLTQNGWGSLPGIMQHQRWGTRRVPSRLMLHNARQAAPAVLGEQ